VYFLAWSVERPTSASPRDPLIQWVGETDNLRKRMGDFGRSAGLWSGVRGKGHSGGCRWPIGRREHLWVLFHPSGDTDLPPHLHKWRRKWMESLAQHEHILATGDLPGLNRCLENFELPAMSASPSTRSDGDKGQGTP